MVVSGLPLRSLSVWNDRRSWMESFVGGPHRYVIPVHPLNDAEARKACAEGIAVIDNRYE